MLLLMFAGDSFRGSKGHFKMAPSLTFALQALLVRHEQYMADAEREHAEMSMKIGKLEMDKKDLEMENQRKAEENKALVAQLDGLNGTIAEAETHVKSLEATLHSTQQELRHLEILASRSEQLEMQLAVVELEQTRLQKAVLTSEEDERTALQRWKQAERGLLDLQEQLERIDREAKEERERHAEVVGRMERQRQVEKELEGAAGRLKSAAAVASIEQGKGGTNVVSHFVKDILQDNANLQLGIIELREMLLNSNDEVQMLREKLLEHQPIDEDGPANTDLPLEAELTLKVPQISSKEVHIHHHYHVPKKEDFRKSKKKRSVVSSGIFTPPRPFQASRTPRSGTLRPTSNSTTATILSQTSTTIPSPVTPQNRWSLQSYQTMSDCAASSVPSSPQSQYRYSSLFDRAYPDQSVSSSRPTSPGSSVDPLSPVTLPYHRKRGSEVSARSFITPMNLQPDNIIHEENDDIEGISPIDQESKAHVECDAIHRNGATESVDDSSPQFFRPSHRRSSSQESIISISGIDIHTLQSRPSQRALGDAFGIIIPRTRLGAAGPGFPILSTEPITSSTTATAWPTLSRHGHTSTQCLRSHIAGQEARSSSFSAESTPGLSKKVGGWVFGRWGASPARSEDMSKDTPHRPSTQRVASAPPSDPLRAIMGRAPGINQKGPIPGLRKPEKAPFKVMPDLVDTAALREVLEE
jgi:hypothetical protein